jgi:hypothetical protein
MADMEVRLKASSEWSDYGGPKKLADAFCKSLSGPGKSPAAVTKARRDPRYMGMVSRLMLSGAGIKRERNPEVRKAVEDAWDRLTSKEDEG